MSFGIEDYIEALQTSRQIFFKHIEGLKDEQWDWKPFVECKSIRETIAHLSTGDRSFIPLMEAKMDIDWASFEESERDINKLMLIIKKTRDDLCAAIRERFSNTPLDQEIKFMGMDMKLGIMLASISYEDYYHAGQVAFIRMATDPAWDYYKEVYGAGM
ncbi:MAG: DinB family protein [Armatimonadota bacterium]